MVAILLLRVQKTAIEERHLLLGIDPDRFIEVGNGVVVIFLRGVDHTAVVEWQRIVRVKADRLGVIGQGPGAVTFVVVDVAAIVVGAGFLGVEPDGLGEIGERPVLFAHAVVDDPTIVDRQRELGIEADGFIEIDERAVLVTLLDVVVAPVVESVGVGFQSDCLAVVGDGAVGFALIGKRQTTVMESERIAGIEADRLAVIGNGVVVVVHAAIGDATIEKSPGNALVRRLARLDQRGAAGDLGLQRILVDFVEAHRLG